MHRGNKIDDVTEREARTGPGWRCAGWLCPNCWWAGQTAAVLTVICALAATGLHGMVPAAGLYAPSMSAQVYAASALGGRAGPTAGSRNRPPL